MLGSPTDCRPGVCAGVKASWRRGSGPRAWRRWGWTHLEDNRGVEKSLRLKKHVVGIKTENADVFKHRQLLLGPEPPHTPCRMGRQPYQSLKPKDEERVGGTQSGSKSKPWN